MLSRRLRYLAPLWIARMVKNRSIISFFGENKLTKNDSTEQFTIESDNNACLKRKTPQLQPMNYKFDLKLTKINTPYHPQKIINNNDIKPINEYEPDTENYDPIKDACWLPNQSVPFIALCLTFKAIEKTSSTLKSTMIAANFFKSVICLCPDDLIPCLYLCMGEIAPSYQGLKLGIGDSTLIQSIANTTGRKKDLIKLDLTETGDLGIVAEKSKVRQTTLVKPKDLTVRKVFENLRDIASISGDKANEKKCAKIQYLYTNCQSCESRYLIRILQKNLRIGLREPLILNAIAHALLHLEQNYGDKKSNPILLQEEMKKAALNIRNAYCVMPNFDLLIPILLEKGWQNIHDYCQISVGTPIKPMLAIPLNKLTDIYTRFGNNINSSNVIFEYKYDGERAQIHYDYNINQFSCFSRNQENQTMRYPELAELLPFIFKTDKKACSFIMDTEIVAYDNELAKIRPFQVLLTRKYKNVTVDNVKVNVCIVAFDLLSYDNESLLCTPLSERLKILKENFVEIDNQFIFAKNTPIDNCNDEAIVLAIDEAVNNQCEGLMVKDLSSIYQINKRSPYWVKLKKDYIDKVGDTLDLVVMGGYHGTGKRTGSYGGFLMGCYDPISDEVQSICRIGTGLSDAVLTKHFEYFQSHLLENPPDYYRYDQNIAADHWFEPIQIWEVKAADMSLSTIHQAARDMIEKDKGISLRFPRFIRVRDDKDMKDATDSNTVVELYKSQASVTSTLTNQSAPVDMDMHINNEHSTDYSEPEDNHIDN